jgi:tetratricopeptide (TPR) repeat protein
MKVYTAISLLLLTQFLFSQISESDSLLQRSESADKPEKAKIFNQLSKLVRYNDPELAIAYGNTALSLAGELNLTEERIEALLNIGTAYNEAGNNDSTLEYHLKALGIANDLGDKKILANVQHNLGVDYRYIGDFDNALKFNISALTLREEKLPSGETVGSSLSIANTLSNIGVVYDDMGNLTKAMEYHNKALTIRTELNNKRGIAASLHNIGVVYEEMGEFDKALDSYSASLKIKNELGNKHEIATTLNNIGIVYLDKKQYDKALDYHFQALEIFKEMEDLYSFANTSNSIADIYLELNQPDMAFPYIQDGLNTANEIDAKRLMLDSYRFLSKYYLSKNNFRAANEAQANLLDLKDTIYNTDMAEKVAEMQTRYETEKKQKEIGMLKKDMEIKNLELQKQKNQKISFAVIAGLVMISGFLVFSRKQLKQKHFRTELEKKNLETEQKLLRTQMNPHFIFNSLNSIQGYISANNSFLAMSYLSKFAKLMRYILENSRKSMVSLEEEINTLQLNMELERIRFKEHFDFKIDLEPDIIPERTFLPPMLLQPYVENAMKHGLRNKPEKGLLEIFFKKENNFLNCIIRDNGIGREKAAELNQTNKTTHKSVGMQLTSERLTALNKQYKSSFSAMINDLKDAEGKALGTEVVLNIPCETE